MLEVALASHDEAAVLAVAALRSVAEEVPNTARGRVANNDEAGVTTICPAAGFVRLRFLEPGTPMLAQSL